MLTVCAPRSDDSPNNCDNIQRQIELVLLRKNRCGAVPLRLQALFRPLRLNINTGLVEVMSEGTRGRGVSPRIELILNVSCSVYYANVSHGGQEAYPHADVNAFARIRLHSFEQFVKRYSVRLLSSPLLFGKADLVQYVFTLGLGTSTVLDVLITGAMCFYLRRRKSGLAKLVPPVRISRGG